VSEQSVKKPQRRHRVLHCRRWSRAPQLGQTQSQRSGSACGSGAVPFIAHLPPPSRRPQDTAPRDGRQRDGAGAVASAVAFAQRYRAHSLQEQLRHGYNARMRIRRLLLGAFLALSSTVPQSGYAWTAGNIANTAFSAQDAQDAGVSVAADPFGNVILAGAVDHAGGGYDFVVVKLAALDGSEMWRYTLPDGTAPSSKDAPHAVTVTPTGDVVAVGRAQYADTKHDFVVVKLDGATGMEAWPPVRINDAAVNGSDSASSVALDPAGDIVAAGYVQTATAPVRLSFTVVKIAGTDGAILWNKRPADGTGASNQAQAVAVDASGDVFAGGFTANGTNLDLRVVKLSGMTGDPVWPAPFDVTGPGEDMATAIALDPMGNLFVTGTTATDASSSDPDIVIAKVNGADGTLLWPSLVTRGGSGTEAPEDQANGLAVDAGGNVLVAGSLVNASADGDTTELAVLKLRGDGSEVWTKTVSGTAIPNFRSQGTAIATDLAGNAVVVGTLDNADTGSTLIALDLDAVTGEERWRVTVDGDAGGNDDEGTALALDSSGNVVVAGRREVAAGRQFVALRLACNGTPTPVDCTGQLVDDCTFGGGCDPATGQCSTGARPDGSPCHDDDACTQDDACQGGACTGTSVDCGGPCVTDAVCDPATGACSATPLPDGTACDDGDACTTADSCQAGICVPPGAQVVPCAIDGATMGAACTGQKLPRGVKKNLKKAKTLVAKAEAVPAKRAKLLGKAATALGKAAKAVDKAATRKKKPLVPACAQALRDAIARAQAAVAALGS
jgi:uncharacterized delta-60 repeat protein